MPLLRNLLVALVSIASVPITLLAAEKPWVPVGPDGGDARAFAFDPGRPSHIYLGTTSGWMYDSEDGGVHWSRLANVGNRNDLVLDSLVIDPAHPATLYVGAWVLGSSDGGLFRSSDSGKTWTQVADMKGQSIRALAVAPSDATIWIAGTLTGVYRSKDAGLHWNRMSPPENAEIHEVESVAFNPKNPDIVYAGTWHLPWKTEDGGKNWHNMKDGLIDDSDVFSIIVDPVVPSVVYASACSGIYKSEDSGQQFHKIQGIPSTARRTRVLMQDPAKRNIVYAGTTEGLYKTSDSGHAWVRMTSGDVIVNDVYIDPADNNHVLLATDRSGVLTSHDGAKSFTDTNHGFEQRQVSALIVDPKDPQKIFAGVVNDKIYGGVFASEDGGATWTQRSQGLAGRDVFALEFSPDGDLLVGTNKGILRLASEQWQESGKVVVMTPKKVVHVINSAKTGRPIRHETVTEDVAVPAPPLDTRVAALSLTSATWYAATAEGIYRSGDKGATWKGGPVLGEKNFQSVAASQSVVLAGQRTRLFVSQDSGENWRPSLLPQGLSGVTTTAIDAQGGLWIGGPEGVWLSHDGNEWAEVKTLPINDISSISWDPGLASIVVTSWKGDLVFGSTDEGAKWKYWFAGWPLRSAHSSNGRLFGASLFNSVVMEPTLAKNSGSSTGGGR